MRIHTGVGHTDNESAQHFDSEKLSQLFLVLRTGFEPLVFESRVDALPIELPRHPTKFYHDEKKCVCAKGTIHADRAAFRLLQLDIEFAARLK